MQYLIMTPMDRQALLRTMRKRLDLIKDDIGTKLQEHELRRYWLLEASFYAVNGANLAETGHAYEAGQNYQIAKGIFEQLGLVQQAEQYKAILQKLKDGGPSAAPASAAGPAVVPVPAAPPPAPRAAAAASPPAQKTPPAPTAAAPAAPEPAAAAPARVQRFTPESVTRAEPAPAAAAPAVRTLRQNQSLHRRRPCTCRPCHCACRARGSPPAKAPTAPYPMFG